MQGGRGMIKNAAMLEPNLGKRLFKLQNCVIKEQRIEIRKFYRFPPVTYTQLLCNWKLHAGKVSGVRHKGMQHSQVLFLNHVVVSYLCEYTFFESLSEVTRQFWHLSLITTCRRVTCSKSSYISLSTFLWLVVLRIPISFFFDLTSKPVYRSRISDFYFFPFQTSSSLWLSERFTHANCVSMNGCAPTDVCDTPILHNVHL